MKFQAAALVATAIGCSAGDGHARGSDSAAAAQTQTPAAATSVASEGEQLYQRCVTCHQANGQGLTGAFPPLAGSEYATAANVAVPIRVVIHGMQGPVTEKGTQYNGLMPPYGVGIAMSDREVVAVLTYVRSSWGNNASAITAEQVAAERAATRAASGPVTAEELAALM
jgi:mono/diheme cytochrome c family protein